MHENHWTRTGGSAALLTRPKSQPGNGRFMPNERLIEAELSAPDTHHRAIECDRDQYRTSSRSWAYLAERGTAPLDHVSIGTRAELIAQPV